MDGRRSIVVPCAIGNAMSLIAKTAIRGTSEDANYGGTYMTFGEAINAAKSGKRIQREGWNGKAQYIELATCISYKNTKGEIVNCKHEAIGNQAFAFVGTSGVQMGWLASQSDMLATDWKFFD